MSYAGAAVGLVGSISGAVGSTITAIRQDKLARKAIHAERAATRHAAEARRAQILRAQQALGSSAARIAAPDVPTLIGRAGQPLGEAAL